MSRLVFARPAVDADEQASRLRYDRATDALVQADETSAAAVWTLDATDKTLSPAAVW
jgi:hypothetical protein